MICNTFEAGEKHGRGQNSFSQYKEKQSEPIHVDGGGITNLGFSQYKKRR
jgi:hypothetical protein